MQTYLKSLEDRTIVVVSHDRSFLDAVSKETILFRHRVLAYHAGSYSGAAALLRDCVLAGLDTICDLQ